MIGCVSGSPMRQLNSRVFGLPLSSIIKPAYKKPVNAMPSLAMPLMVGLIISRITRACMAGVTIGAGEYAPMPPVFGPSSASLRRL